MTVRSTAGALVAPEARGNISRKAGLSANHDWCRVHKIDAHGVACGPLSSTMRRRAQPPLPDDWIDVGDSAAKLCDTVADATGLWALNWT